MRSLSLAAAAALAFAAPAAAQGVIGFAGPANAPNPAPIKPVPFRPYVLPRAVGVPAGQPALAIFPDQQTYRAMSVFTDDFPRRYAATLPPRYVQVLVTPAAPVVDPADDPARAKVTLQVPLTAEVFIGGQKLNQNGATRTFVSPPLEAGQRYRYAVLVRWSDNGKDVERKLDVPVRAGDRPTVMVLAPAAK